MNEPRWLERRVIEAIHDEQLSQHGGAQGLRDEGMLESALGRPMSKWMYETPDLSELAAAYAFGIARNHPFVDGNKRTAFLAAYVFLGLNGINLECDEAEVVVMTLGLAGSEIDEAGYAAWIRDHTTASD